MPQTIHTLLIQYLSEVQKIYGTHLKSVILYGSYARGDYTPILGFAIDLGGITAGLFVVLLCVAYLMYCAFGIKVKKVS